MPTDKEVKERGGFGTEWYARKMPMSCMVLMENLTDPSHFSFAHHGTDKSVLPLHQPARVLTMLMMRTVGSGSPRPRLHQDSFS